jgi:hypothetical protein
MRAMKKPLPVEVWRITDMRGDETMTIPGWVMKAIIARDVEAADDGGLVINTNEGEMHGSIGDWLVKGNPNGELWAVASKVFNDTYDILPS